MKTRLKKKAEMFWTIIGMVIAFFAFVTYLSMTKTSAAGIATTQTGLFDSTGDFDSDGVVNQFDLCVCDKGDISTKGCPEEKYNDETELQKTIKECNERIAVSKNTKTQKK